MDNMISKDRLGAFMDAIIAMTANAFADDVVKCKEAGMNEHIAKPFSVEDLARVLHEYMDVNS